VGAGLVAIAWGLWQLVVVAPNATHPVVALVWLAGALVAHDAVLAPLTLLVGFVVVRVTPSRVRRLVAVLLFVAVSLLVVGAPGALKP
jgi:hypothetical protein